MSKVAIQGNASGTGTFTIAAPNSNTDRSLTLPDEAGTVLTSVSDIESQVKTATNATGTAPIYACRAWVNFNGTGTVAIRASGNVSSITDRNTGRYTVNFSTAMPDANYSAVIYNNAQATTDGDSFANTFLGGAGSRATSSLDVTAFNGSAYADSALFDVAIFR